jgi:hypothetical protein
MIKTKQRTRKQISNLSLEIEIINPIESKTLFGGCNYCNNGYSQATGWACQNQYYSSSSWNSGPTSPANFSGFVFSGPTDNSWGSSYTGNENYSDTNGDGINDADQTNTWSDSNGDGFSDENQMLLDNYPGNLTEAEANWLKQRPSFIYAMTQNCHIAFEYGVGHNGRGDALRHALWSALDAFDIGRDNAFEFHTLHETEHYDTDYPRRDEELVSDMHNNAWGYNWATLNGNAEGNINQFIADFNLALANGEISIVAP